MNRPTLSVGIAYFNERELLRDCLESLLAQDVRPDEIVVFDNGSDDSPEPYIPRGERIRLVRSAPNRGPAFAHNRLLAETNGDYLHLHDSDDLFSPGWTRRVLETIERTGTDAVFTDAAVYRGGELLLKSMFGPPLRHADRDWVRFCIERHPMMILSTVRRQRALRLRFREALAISDDTDFHIRLAASGADITALPEPLVAHRVRAEGWSADPVSVLRDVAEQYSFLIHEIPAQHRLSLARQARLFGAVALGYREPELARCFFRYVPALGIRPGQVGGKLYGAAARLLGFEAAERLSRSRAGAAWRRLRSARRAAFLPRRREYGILGSGAQ